MSFKFSISVPGRRDGLNDATFVFDNVHADTA